MRLTPKDIDFFKRFNSTQEWRDLKDYLGRLKQDVFNPVRVNKENIDSIKEAIRIIEEEIEDKINLTNKDKTNKPNQYE